MSIKYHQVIRFITTSYLNYALWNIGKQFINLFLEELVETRRRNTLSGDEWMGTPFQLPDKSDLIVAYSTVQGYRY